MEIKIYQEAQQRYLVHSNLKKHPIWEGIFILEYNKEMLKTKPVHISGSTEQEILKQYIVWSVLTNIGISFAKKDDVKFHAVLILRYVGDTIYERNN